ncbi:MAG: class C sortase [Oscillospiraceae bacterium]|nr:class C sortase [Oscillospiraceae bacterium]
MKKKYIIGIFVALVVLADLFFLLYPTVSDKRNARRQSRVVAHYFDDVESMEDGGALALLEAARAYNEALPRKADRFRPCAEETAAYKSLLDTGRGIMGVLAIDKLDLKLPIYHGTDEGVLQIGLGHMQGSSLPVGGAGTHAFITGHRGLPSSTLLSKLDKLTEGDVFKLYIMGETLSYRVDKIQTVEPHEVNALDIEPALDLCTLVTCTPYGVNTHRLLVRGQRTANAAEPGGEAGGAGARRLDWSGVILTLLLPAIPATVIYAIFKRGKIRKGVVQR